VTDWNVSAAGSLSASTSVRGISMVRKVASVVFLIDSLIIGLGAFGHGSQAAHVHAAIDRFPIEPDLHSMIYVVWYFVSGCMLTFGALLIWVWMRLRTGDRERLAVAILIGILYVGIGVFGLVYRSGDPFMGFFVALGGVLLTSGFAAARPPRSGITPG
jgi:hypothetical protein